MSPYDTQETLPKPDSSSSSPVLCRCAVTYWSLQLEFTLRHPDYCSRKLIMQLSKSDWGLGQEQERNRAAPSRCWSRSG